MTTLAARPHLTAVEKRVERLTMEAAAKGDSSVRFGRVTVEHLLDAIALCRNELARVRVANEEVAALRRENEQLKAENERLRVELAKATGWPE